MAIEIVDFPMNSMVIKQTKVYWLVVKKPSWKIWEFVNGKDDIPYMKRKIENVWNHQPDNVRPPATIAKLVN